MDHSIGCLLLAGGQGKRMGHVDKMTLQFHNQTFGDQIADELEKTGLHCYLSIANYEHSHFRDWKIIPDIKFDDAYIGPLGGIYTALKEVSKLGLKGLYVVSCDTPLFNCKLIETMAPYTDHYDIVLYQTSNQRIHYTIGYYSTNCITIIENHISNHQYRLSLLSNSCSTKILEVDNCSIFDDWFTNYNHLDDLKTL